MLSVSFSPITISPQHSIAIAQSIFVSLRRESLSNVNTPLGLSFNFYIKLSMQNVNNTNAFDLKCLSLNVRGLNKSIQRRSIFRWLHKQKHHIIIFLQESYGSKDLESVWENEWGGNAFF